MSVGLIVIALKGFHYVITDQHISCVFSLKVGCKRVLNFSAALAGQK